MAGEQTAKVYEALVEYAVYRALKLKGVDDFVVEREVLLDGVSIRTDVLVRSSQNEPIAAYLITHSNREVDWQKKFQRDSSEFIEHAISDAPVENIILVIFDAATLPGLEKTASIYLTSIISVNKFDPTGALEAFGHDISVKKAISDDSKNTRAIIKKLLETFGKKPAFSEAFSKLILEIAKTIIAGKKSKKNQTTTFISLTRQMVDYRSSNRPKWKIRHTRFNRAISKIALFPKSCWAPIFESKPITGNFEWACQNVFWPIPGGKGEKGPLCRKLIGGKFRCGDPEIIGGAVGSSKEGYDIDKISKLINIQQLKNIINVGRQPMLDRYFERIQIADDVLRNTLSFFSSSYKEMIKPNQLSNLFIKCSNNPSQTYLNLCNPKSQVDVTWHWAYTSLVALFKASTGKKQGYGYSKIARLMPTPSYRSAVQHSILQHLEYGLKQLPEALIHEVANAMTIHLKQIQASDIKGLIDKAIKYFIWSECEDKAIPNGVDVLPAMIKIAATELNLPMNQIQMKSCLSEAAGAEGTAGVTNFFKIQDTILWYKTAHYRGHVRDKKKEITSVISGLKQSWNNKSKKFFPTKLFEKAILVIDGDWLEEDLCTLYDFGWDEFIYPDQLGNLTKYIK